MSRGLARPTPAARRVQRRVIANASVVGAFAVAGVMYLVTAAFAPGAAEASYVRFLLIVASFIGLTGIGQTFVVLSGGIDLSIPYTVTMAGAVTTFLARGADGDLVWIIPLTLGLAGVIGLANGIGVAILRVSPIIMTLAMNVIVQGALAVTLPATPPSSAPPLVGSIALGDAGGIPTQVLAWLLLGVSASVLLTMTPYGRRLYAIGTNETVARLSGVWVSQTVILAYVISGLTSGAAGILLVGFLGRSFLGMGDPYLFASVAAVAIGGASLLGGHGHYLGTVAGALVLTLLAGILPILGLDQGWLQVIYGAVILITVGLATVGPKRAN